MLEMRPFSAFSSGVNSPPLGFLLGCTMSKVDPFVKTTK
jgi:hypothetical protein